jgi:hypothetical protein
MSESPQEKLLVGSLFTVINEAQQKSKRVVSVKALQRILDNYSAAKGYR